MEGMDSELVGPLILEEVKSQEEEEIMLDHRPIYSDNNNRDDASMKQRRLATTLYLLTTSLLFADQNLMSPNLSAIADEFGFDNNTRDKKLGGDIAIAFFMVGVPASFIVGSPSFARLSSFSSSPIAKIWRCLIFEKEAQ